MPDELPINVLPDDEREAIECLLSLVSNNVLNVEHAADVWVRRHEPRKPGFKYFVMSRKGKHTAARPKKDSK